STRRVGRHGSLPAGSASATFATTPRAASAPPGATCGRCAVWSARERALARSGEGDSGEPRGSPLRCVAPSGRRSGTIGAGVNERQQAAVEATGEVFVSAGAGTGKTAVLVERFVRAVCDRGLDVDSILVITYTRRAAGELRTRIRAALAERGRSDLARELDGAWISTIHGFCLRLLKAHPFAAGL